MMIIAYIQINSCVIHLLKFRYYCNTVFQQFFTYLACSREKGPTQKFHAFIIVFHYSERQYTFLFCVRNLNQN